MNISHDLNLKQNFSLDHKDTDILTVFKQPYNEDLYLVRIGFTLCT